MKIRDDLTLAAYAAHLGYTINGRNAVKIELAGLFNDDGIPHDELQFTIGDVHVWNTSRGWRVSRLVDGRFEKPTDSCFFPKLKKALDEGARNWRDR